MMQYHMRLIQEMRTENLKKKQIYLHKSHQNTAKYICLTHIIICLGYTCMKRLYQIIIFLGYTIDSLEMSIPHNYCTSLGFITKRMRKYLLILKFVRTQKRKCTKVSYALLVLNKLLGFYNSKKVVKNPRQSLQEYSSVRTFCLDFFFKNLKNLI